MKLTNMDKIEDTPDDYPETTRGKTQMQWLKYQIRDLVDKKLVAETVKQYQLDNDAIPLDNLYAYCLCNIQ